VLRITPNTTNPPEVRPRAVFERLFGSADFERDPDPAMISTSHIERSKLTMRTQIKRLARLTLSFSKKWENLWFAIALHFAYYNFCRTHRTLRVTPAMESNLTDHVWTIGELLA
jgi:hypothetical protein